MGELCVGVLGASSLVGGCLLSLLPDTKWKVVAFSRQIAESSRGGVRRRLTCTEAFEEISQWICVAPIWVLPDYFSFIEASGARRVVVLSSTSRFTKIGSEDPAENATVSKLIDGEARVQSWAESRGIEWVILRPTLIYGLGRDKNISEIARFIRHFGFFPVLGRADGLRQPIHAEDVAATCLSALQAPVAANRAYNITGGETITYREMVVRIFEALGRRQCLLTVPLWVFRLSASVLRRLPRCRNWSPAMAERMNRDLVFDYADATRELGFTPRGFRVCADDLE